MKKEFQPPKGKIIKISGNCISLVGDDIDTDRIIPARFLKCVDFESLGDAVFEDDRKDLKGKHPFDLKSNQNAVILLVNSNFGCGSSREHAPWALLDFGIKSIISTSFADIFYNNCFKNGILPIIVDESTRDEISMLASEGQNISINLEDQNIIIHNKVFNFEIDPYRKECLLKGLDDIGITLENENSISNYEKNFNNNNWNIPNQIK